jgi:hypothetical protein
MGQITKPLNFTACDTSLYLYKRKEILLALSRNTSIYKQDNPEKLPMEVKRKYILHCTDFNKIGS